MTGHGEATQPDGRTRHYGVFYGLDPLPPSDGRPLVLVWGNCQAEALRQLLDPPATDSASGRTGTVRSLRVPPVHEITVDDLPHLHRILRRLDVLLAQPVATGYRDLPIGTADLAAGLCERARVVRWPVLFDSGLYPFQALVRQPGLGDPPLVPYHDLRTLLAAATGRRPEPTADPQVYRELARRSLERLAQRERHHETLSVSGTLGPRRATDFHTINHPGNDALLATARLAAEALAGDAPEPFEPVDPVDPVDPGRILLRAVLTPHEPRVLQALGIDAAAGRETWLLGGEPTPEEQVREAHLEFYRHHPGFVEEGLRRHADTIAALGLA